MLPAYPSRARLLPFFVSATTTFKFFVDSDSLSVGEDGVVRYALVARSAEGAETVTYEGMRCKTQEFRIYATGSQGSWTRVDKPWRPIELPHVQPWEEMLYRQYFCPLGDPIRNGAEGAAALRKGAERGQLPGGNY